MTDASPTPTQVPSFRPAQRSGKELAWGVERWNGKKWTPEPGSACYYQNGAISKAKRLAETRNGAYVGPEFDMQDDSLPKVLRDNPSALPTFTVRPPPPRTPILKLDGSPSGLIREKLVERIVDPVAGDERGGPREIADVLAKMPHEAGDELWFYKDIAFLSGWGGYVLLRGGKLVARIVTIRS